MSDIKKCLKEAKNAIKDKDFEAASIHCKDALKIDRKNYQALVMFGRVCQEQKEYLDSKKALQVAIQIDSSNPIAWQGMSSLLDKDNLIFNKQEEVELLSYLKTSSTDKEKQEKYVYKLADVHQRYESPEDAVNVLEDYMNSIEETGEKLKHYKAVINIIQKTIEKKDNPDLSEKLIFCYKAILNDSTGSENETNYQNFLRLLYKRKQYKNIVENAQIMCSIFPTAYPLEWIARSYFECTTLKDEDSALLDLTEDKLEGFLDKLLSLYSSSPWANLAYGVFHLRRKDNEDAANYLRKGCDILGSNIEAWLIYLDCLSETNDYARIENTCRKIQSILKTKDELKLPASYSNKNTLNQFVQLKRATALFHLGHTNHLLQAVDILKEVSDRDVNTTTMLVKALVKLKYFEQASNELEVLKKCCSEDSPDIKELIALIARNTGNVKIAQEIYEQVLQQNPASDEALFQLGRIYFETQDYQKSFVHLLKAAKINPKNGSAFLYIGHYYKLSENFEKARKCYEKSLDLSPFDEESGASLSDIYRITGEHTANVSLLLRVTDSTGRSGGGWAWLRLGLHYMAHFNYEEAVRCLQCAVEINHLDRVSLECLGDAYLLRGSHTAALKVFNKAAELDPQEAVYSRCKIAQINCIIGELLLCISEFEEVIGCDPPLAVKTVALVGLAQALINRAKSHKEQIFLENVKSDCQYAIDCLTRAANESGKNLTLWKLLGDACTLQANVPPSHSSFTVPKRLLDSSETDLSAVVQMNKDELLNLGARCYGVGLRISDQNASLWHDLGVNLFLQVFIHLRVCKGTKFSQEDLNLLKDESGLLDRSLTTLKKSISLDPDNHNAWNSLGVVAFYQEDLGLSQHCLITSLSCQPTVKAWTNLGALYLAHQNVYLGHEAFSQAQALDPEYVACWVGQALVADAVDHYEAFDLYRHTTLLGIHPESCLGFAHKTLAIVNDPKQSKAKMTTALSLLPSVSDSLTFYTREKEFDVVGLNMCGMTLEMIGLKQSAAQVYEKAVEVFKEEVVPRDLQDIVLFNYSRLLTSLGRLDEASHYFSLMEEPDFYSQCALAIAKLKGNQFDEAYQKYTEALVWLAPDDIQKSYVLVALAFLQYKYNNIEQVKTLLFQSSTVVQGLLALTALGLLQGDSTLTSAAMAELVPYVDSKDHVHDVTFLKATQATLQGDLKKAKNIYSRAIHRHPENAALWRSLAQHLLSMKAQHSSVPQNTIAAAAKQASATAITLSQAVGDKQHVAQDVVIKVLSYLKAAQCVPQKKKSKARSGEESIAELKSKSLKEAQRAVLMCPHQSQTWAVLIAALGSSKRTRKLAEVWSCKADQKLKVWFADNYLQSAS